MKFRQCIAAVITTIILVFVIIGYFTAVFFIPFPIWIKIVGAVILMFFIGAAIFVLIERINEIRSGEQDDLGKY